VLRPSPRIRAISSPCHTRFPLSDVPLWTRQYAYAFNQPLSFDTSRVTDMSYMFYVRFRLRLFCPAALPSCGPHTRMPRRVRCFAAPFPSVPSPLRATRASLCRMSLWTRQYASAFNQPLSFDTSSVTDMSGMFEERFRLRLLPPLPTELGLYKLGHISPHR
jgi:hypothetical protein